jgi:hypothetical protein
MEKLREDGRDTEDIYKDIEAIAVSLIGTITLFFGIVFMNTFLLPYPRFVMSCSERLVLVLPLF